MRENMGIDYAAIGRRVREKRFENGFTQVLNTTLDYLVGGIEQRCKGEKCGLYADMEALLRAYGFDTLV